MVTRNPHIGTQWGVVAKIVIVGIVMIIYVACWARVDELSHESRRLDRLIAAETLRQGELARQRAVICNLAKLEKFAQPHGMVKSPIAPRQITVAALPEPDAPDALKARTSGIEPQKELAAQPAPAQASMAATILRTP